MARGARSSRSAASARPSAAHRRRARLAGRASGWPGTAMNVSAIVPPTQTVAPSTCRTTRVISSQCGTALACTRMEGWSARTGTASTARQGLLFGVEPNRFLVAEVDGLAPGRALDLACGAGRNAVWLAERGWTVTGVDFSDVALERRGGSRPSAASRSSGFEADLREWLPEPARVRPRRGLYLQLPVEERRVVLRPGCSRGRSRRHAARRRPRPREPRSPARAARRTRACCSTPRRSPRSWTAS